MKLSTFPFGVHSFHRGTWKHYVHLMMLMVQESGFHRLIYGESTTIYLGFTPISGGFFAGFLTTININVSFSTFFFLAKISIISTTSIGPPKRYPRGFTPARGLLDLRVLIRHRHTDDASQFLGVEDFQRVGWWGWHVMDPPESSNPPKKKKNIKTFSVSKKKKRQNAGEIWKRRSCWLASFFWSVHLKNAFFFQGQTCRWLQDSVRDPGPS